MNNVHMNGVHIRSMALWKQVGAGLLVKTLNVPRFCSEGKSGP